MGNMLYHKSTEEKNNLTDANYNDYEIILKSKSQSFIDYHKMVGPVFMQGPIKCVKVSPPPVYPYRISIDGILLQTLSDASGSFVMEHAYLSTPGERMSQAKMVKESMGSYSSVHRSKSIYLGIFNDFAEQLFGTSENKVNECVHLDPGSKIYLLFHPKEKLGEEMKITWEYYNIRVSDKHSLHSQELFVW
jgi:hypothetical protein